MVMRRVGSQLAAKSRLGSGLRSCESAPPGSTSAPALSQNHRHAFQGPVLSQSAHFSRSILVMFSFRSVAEKIGSEVFSEAADALHMKSHRLVLLLALLVASAAAWLSFCVRCFCVPLLHLLLCAAASCCCGCSCCCLMLLLIFIPAGRGGVESQISTK